MIRYLSGLTLVIAIVPSVLWGCVECRAQSETGEGSSPVTLPAGTPVVLRLTKTLYKKDAKLGQAVEFEVAYDVVVNGQIVIRNGTAAGGTVGQVDQTGRAPAKVIIDLAPTQTVSDEKVRLGWISSSFSSNGPGVTGVLGLGAAAGPALPALAIASLFEKEVLLDKNAWSGWRAWPGDRECATRCRETESGPGTIRCRQASSTDETMRTGAAR